MPVQRKSNAVYYFCQVLGLAVVLGFSLLGIYTDPEFQTAEIQDAASDYFIKNILSYTVAILLTHYLLRDYQLKNQVTELKALLKLILQCALIGTITDKLLEWTFGLPEPDIFIYQYGILVELFFYLFINSIFFLIWSLLYLTITSIRDRRKLATQLKDQQLASLMNQINPHFLFNSLNTIRGMIYEDEDKAADLITQLSTLFRYNLSTDTKAYTSLGKELEVCQHYLSIEDIRLGARLAINMNISPESKNAKIPTMGLLTIVENAIKHGIANLKDGGTLTLNSAIRNNMLIIDVINPYQADLVKSGTKVGLKNLSQRIELIFGKQGVLSQETDNDTFHVNMSLPYEPIKNG
ncbi:MAG: histidine kinase [Colwellia sp.]|nr:histidine kinase [Colwellia sp.]